MLHHTSKSFIKKQQSTINNLTIEASQFMESILPGLFGSRWNRTSRGQPFSQWIQHRAIQRAVPPTGPRLNGNGPSKRCEFVKYVFSYSERNVAELALETDLQKHECQWWCVNGGPHIILLWLILSQQWKSTRAGNDCMRKQTCYIRPIACWQENPWTPNLFFTMAVCQSVV